jgi:signal transduction histidine kinase
MVFVSSALIIVPFILMVLLTEFMKDKVVSYQYSAASIMCDDIEKIAVDDIVKYHGGVQVITKELKVIQLGGIQAIPSKQLSVTEWTAFLIQSNKEELDNYNYSVAYNEKEQFWLVVELPISLIFKVYYNFNTDSVNFNGMVCLFAGILLTYLLLLIISAIIYSKLTGRSFVNPIKSLCRFMKDLEDGRYHKTEEMSSILEFNKLQEGFNHLADELKLQESVRQEMQENRNRLIRDISHDLKNPLASIQGYAEMYLKQKELPNNTRDNYVNIIYNNSLRANNLIQSLFQYSQINSCDFKLNLQKTDLCELLRNKLAFFIPILEEKNFSYEINIPDEDIIYSIDVLQMNRVFDNLLDNAVKYNEAGTKITVIIRKAEQNIIITISDSGRGMEEMMSEFIFEPFIKVDEKVRNSENGGSGLGLAIVKRIIELHNGVIKLDTKPGEGCRFDIYLNIF